MTVEDLDAKINARRKGLKDGRIAEADRNFESDYTSNDSETRATFQTARREIERLTANNRQPQADNRQPGDNRRGAEAEPIGIRRANRRPGNSDGGLALNTADHATASTRAVGRMEADGPIPERKLDPDAPVDSFEPEEKKSLFDRYPKAIEILNNDPDITARMLAATLGIGKTTANDIKQEYKEKYGQSSQETSVQGTETSGEKSSGGGLKLPNIFKTTEQQSNKSGASSSRKTLSKSEVEEYQETLVNALESDFQALDEYLWHRQLVVGIDTDEQPVWSDLDTEEIEKLTKIMLKWGQRNATAAVVVRGVVESSDYIAVASIFVPRVKSTVDIMRKTRRPRKRRGGKQDES